MPCIPVPELKNKITPQVARLENLHEHGLAPQNFTEDWADKQVKNDLIVFSLILMLVCKDLTSIVCTVSLHGAGVRYLATDFW